MTFKFFSEGFVGVQGWWYGAGGLYGLVQVSQKGLARPKHAAFRRQPTFTVNGSEAAGAGVHPSAFLVKPCRRRRDTTSVLLN